MLVSRVFFPEVVSTSVGFDVVRILVLCVALVVGVVVVVCVVVAVVRVVRASVAFVVVCFVDCPVVDCQVVGVSVVSFVVCLVVVVEVHSWVFSHVFRWGIGVTSYLRPLGRFLGRFVTEVVLVEGAGVVVVWSITHFSFCNRTLFPRS